MSGLLAHFSEFSAATADRLHRVGAKNRPGPLPEPPSNRNSLRGRKESMAEFEDLDDGVDSFSERVVEAVIEVAAAINPESVLRGHNLHVDGPRFDLVSER